MSDSSASIEYMKELVELRDYYAQALRKVKEECKEAEEKGQYNWHQKLMTREADFHGFVCDLDDIIKKNETNSSNGGTIK